MAAGVGASGRNYGVYGGGGGSNLDGLIQAQGAGAGPSASSSQPLEGFFISGSSPSFMGASSSMVSFEDVCGAKRSSDRPFLRMYDWDETGEDEFDDYFQQPEKKRRLTTEQVRFLERSFAAENKLEPERKIQLAKELGLQPRQVAIWFQNRRARWKNKQLEKDYDTLQASFNSLKADYDNLLKEKEILKAEVVYLSDKLHQKEEPAGGDVETSDSENQFQASSQEPVMVDPPASDDQDNSPRRQQESVHLFSPKLEDLPSVGSPQPQPQPPPPPGNNALDAESSFPYADRCHLIMSGLLSDPASVSSAYNFEPDCSEVSQGDVRDINLNSNIQQENLLSCSSHVDAAFEAMNDVDYGDHDASANSCRYGISVEEEDDSPWIWSY